MTERPYVIDQLISAKAIAARVEGLAREISDYYAGTDKLVVVGLLRGSFVFIADLVREIDLPVEVDFLEVSSYGMGTEFEPRGAGAEGPARRDRGQGRAGRRGHRRHRPHAARVLEFLGTRHPARLEVCALLDKPSRREVEVKAKWVGFEIPDAFVVGYGIDYAQRNRNLPHIGAVRFVE